MTRALLFLLSALGLSAQTFPVLNPFRFSSFLSGTNVTFESLAVKTNHNGGTPVAMTNSWTHVITNSVQNAYAVVVVSAIGGTAGLSDVDVTKSFAGAAMTLLYSTNSGQHSLHIYGKALGNQASGNQTVVIGAATNLLTSLSTISYVCYNVFQSVPVVGVSYAYAAVDASGPANITNTASVWPGDLAFAGYHFSGISSTEADNLNWSGNQLTASHGYADTGAAFVQSDAAFTNSAAGEMWVGVATGTFNAWGIGFSLKYSDSISDSFDRADNTDLGTIWSGNYSDATNNQIVSSKVRAVAVLGLDGVETYNATLTDNQWAQITLSTFDTAEVSFGGVVLRAASPTAKTMYVAMAYTGEGSGAEVYVRKYVAGADTDLTNRAVSWVAGDVLRAEVSGTTITVKRNGTSVVQVADSDIASGRAGLFLWNFSNLDDIELDSFSAGNQ